MGNGFAKQLRRLGHCFTKSAGEISGRHEDATAVMMMVPSEVGLGIGHSFCYIRPDPFRSDSSSISSSARTTATTFSSISGASISANNSTPLSTSLNDSSALDKASAFDSSGQFFSVPLQPVPKSLHLSGGGGGSGNLTAAAGPGSNPLGFLSGPIQRQLYFSGNLDHKPSDDQLRSFSQEFSDQSQEQQQKRQNFVKKFKRVIARTVARPRSMSREVVEPKKMDGGVGFSGEFSGEFINGSIQWAQGKAGEDRMQVVISEESGWVFVGIYDGFSGPDAPDYLISNLYSNVHKELEVEGVLDHGNEIDHSGVLRALSLGLEKTEAGFLEEADKLVTENPELALMGSCVLVMVMKGEDVYLMNVGDSRAVLAHKVTDPDTDIIDKCRDEFTALTSLQLTKDHSTYIQEEVERIKKEHADDAYAIMNDRVKGYLKVTRAFGAGFLKQPKWNDALLEMFQIDFIGTSPYITCVPSLRHHKLGPSDRFLILCSDGLNQYFTNQEAVSSVESFLDTFPEGDPAQHLIEQVLFRAARKAGMDFHELLDIPQGDRRRYHDDVSVIIISLEGRIWRSSM